MRRQNERVVGPVRIPFTNLWRERAYLVSATVMGPGAGRTELTTSSPRIPGNREEKIWIMSPLTWPSEIISIPACTCDSTATRTACRNGENSLCRPLPLSTGKLPTTVVGRGESDAKGSAMVSGDESVPVAGEEDCFADVGETEHRHDQPLHPESPSRVGGIPYRNGVR